MKDSTDSSSEAPASWLSSLASCYTPFVPCLRRDRRRVLNGSQSPVVQRQPLLQPAISPLSETDCRQPGRREQESREARRQRRMRPAGRDRFFSDAASRRPLISAPTNFRHLHSGHFPESGHSPPRNAQCFAQHEAAPSRHDPARTVTPPPPAYIASQGDEEDRRLLHHTNHSPLSFHIPRRQVKASSPAEEAAPRIPPRAQGRDRPYSAQRAEALRERVASAMIEAERLQKQIDDVVERQSVYSNSRPSTPHSIACPVPALEPMPSIPALPPAAPSFAQRLHLGAAPSLTTTRGAQPGPSKASTVVDDDSFPTRQRWHCDGQTLAQPPRLTLRPPLRKKKSFSHVSNWLYTEAGPDRDTHVGASASGAKDDDGSDEVHGLASATNGARRRSYDSLESASTWDTDGDRTAPTTTWSPGSSSAARQDQTAPLERRAVFGENSKRRAKLPLGAAV